MTKCRIEDCAEKAVKFGLCKVHIQTQIESGADMTKCGVDGCEKSIKTFGLCKSHYIKHHMHGDVHYQTVGYPTICTEENCAQTSRVRGYCIYHYAKRRSTGKFTQQCTSRGCSNTPTLDGRCEEHPRAIITSITRLCTVEGCANKHLAKGLCRHHRDKYKYSLKKAAKPTNSIVTCISNGCKTHHRDLKRTGLCSVHSVKVKAAKFDFIFVEAGGRNMDQVMHFLRESKISILPGSYIIYKDKKVTTVSKEVFDLLVKIN